MAADDSIYQLAQRVGPALLRLRAVTDRFKIDVDDAIVLLMLGAMNVNRKGVVSLWAPVSIDEFFANLKDCPRDRIRQQLRKLKARGLVISNADGFVVSDMLTWRTMAEAITDVTGTSRGQQSPQHPELSSGEDALTDRPLFLRLVQAVESIERKIEVVQK